MHDSLSRADTESPLNLSGLALDSGDQGWRKAVGERAQRKREIKQHRERMYRAAVVLQVCWIC